MPFIARFLLVSTFFEDAIRLVADRDMQVLHAAIVECLLLIFAAPLRSDFSGCESELTGLTYSSPSASSSRWLAHRSS